MKSELVASGSGGEVVNRPWVARAAEDKGNKLQTGKSPEMVCDLSGITFEGMYGHGGAYKAALEVLSKRRFTSKLPTEKEAYRSVNDPALTPSERDEVVFRGLLTGAGGYVTQEDLETLERTPGDRVLVIGDPFKVMDKRLKGRKVVTVDYEFGGNVGMDGAHSPDDVKRALAKSLNGRDTESNREDIFGLPPGILDKLELLMEFTTRKDLSADPAVNFLLGPDRNKWGPRTRTHKIDGAMGQLLRMTRETDNLDSPQAAAALEERWDAFQKSVAAFMNTHGVGRGYDTSWGLSPQDEILLQLQRLTGQVSTAVKCYRGWSEASDQFVSKHIEELADLHVQLAPRLAERVLSSTEATYRQIWFDYLRSQGVEEPAEYRWDDPESKFVDHFAGFLKSYGSKAVMFLAPGRYPEIMTEEAAMINKATGCSQAEKDDGRFIEGIFPVATRHLPAESFDRVQASWSITAHMWVQLSDAEKGEALEEVYRLLAKNGVAVLFPIGHEDESEIGDTRRALEVLQARCPDMDVRLFPSPKYGTPSHEFEHTLVISKGPIVDEKVIWFRSQD